MWQTLSSLRLTPPTAHTTPPFNHCLWKRPCFLWWFSLANLFLATITISWQRLQTPSVMTQPHYTLLPILTTFVSYIWKVAICFPSLVWTFEQFHPFKKRLQQIGWLWPSRTFSVYYQPLNGRLYCTQHNLSSATFALATTSCWHPPLCLSTYPQLSLLFTQI